MLSTRKMNLPWTHAFLLTIFLSSISSQSIQIKNLDKNPGLLTLELGESFIKIGHHKIFHIIDCESYEPMFTKLSATLNGLKAFGNFTDLIIQLESKFNTVQNLYHNLLPISRQRRGLINVLGTTIKQITGNLDNNDLIQISEMIKKLESNNQILINENNEQVKINNQLQNRFNRVIEELEKQHNQIRKNIIQHRSDLGQDKTMKLLQEILKINIYMDTLNAHLESISESIHLARLNIISKNILSYDELHFVLEHLRNQGITINHPEQAYQFLGLNAFYNHSKIIFIVTIPLFDYHKYETFLLEPLTVGNRSIKLPATKIIIGEEETFFVIKDCQQVSKYYVCGLENLRNSTKDSCFSTLLRGSPGNCIFKEVGQPSEVKLVTDNYIVIKQMVNGTLQTTCGVRNRTLTGTFLLEFHNCTVVINDLKFSSDEMIKIESPRIFSLDGLDIQVKAVEPEQTFERLNIINRHRLDTLTKMQNLHSFTSLTLSGLSIILGVAVFLYLIWNSKLKTERSPGNLQPRTNRDDSSSEEGLVKEQSSSAPDLAQRLEVIRKKQQEVAVHVHKISQAND